MSLKEILDKLVLHSKLERDRAEEKLLGQSFSVSDGEVCLNWINNHLENKDVDNCLGCLTCMKVLLKSKCLIPDQFIDKLSSECLTYHEHDEYRVRLLAGECMGLICGLRGLDCFKQYYRNVYDGINKYLSEREEPTDKLLKKISKEEVFHDTAGWKSLESWMKCLEMIIIGIGDNFINVVDIEMIELIFRAMDHINRFVRETGYSLIGAVAEHKGCSSDPIIFNKVCDQLRKGLCDNWSQVRMSASVATRKLLLSPRPVSVSEKHLYASLLPPMLLNRHYLAEGVRLYSQETWKLSFGNEGRNFVTSYIKETVQFLIEQSDADNHAVREAACGCMAEISEKLDKNDIHKVLGSMLDALLVAFYDDSWPVRDVACVASGRLIALFPAEQGTLFDLEKLYPLFMGNITDSIASVREGASASWADVLGSLQGNSLEKYLKQTIDSMTENFNNIKHQKADSKSAEGLDHSTPGVFGVVSGIIGEDTSDNRHSDQQMFSCGSLAPKMNKGRIKGGCHDGQFHRNSEEWEKADGCISLVGELSIKCLSSHAYMSSLIGKISETSKYKHYPHHVYLLITVCKCIPKLYKGLGKQTFKQYLNDLLVIVQDAIECDCALTVAAAEDCIQFLATSIGSNILKGRIEMVSLDFLDKVRHLLAVQQF